MAHTDNYIRNEQGDEDTDDADRGNMMIKIGAEMIIQKKD